MSRAMYGMAWGSRPMFRCTTTRTRAFPTTRPSTRCGPVVYGYVGRAFDLMRVGVWLPTILYFSALVFGYLWARQLAPRVRCLGFDVGHAFVAILAVTRDFYVFTSVPYTEGLAYTLLFVGLWRMHPAWSQPTWPRGAEFGVWLALGYLARSQSIVFAMAGFAAVFGASVLSDNRRDYGKMAAAMAVTFLLVCLPHIIHVQLIVERNGISPLFAFDHARASWILSDFHVMVKKDTLWEYIVDRAQGVPVAFRYAGRYSYARQFHLIQYALVGALPLLLLALAWVRRRHFAPAWAWLRSNAAVGPVFLVLFALAGFLSIHALHKVYFVEWNFARRQSVSCVFAFFCAWLYLASHRARIVRLAALLLVLANTYEGAQIVEQYSTKSLSRKGPRPYFAGLTRWLEARAAAETGSVTVAVNAQVAQRLAPYTRNVGYHWMHNGTRISDIETMISELGVRYVILRNAGSYLRRRGKNGRKWFKEHLRQVKKMGKFTIYEPV